MDQVVCENGVCHDDLLSASNDDHDGVIVDMKEPMDAAVFRSMLRASISQWRKQGKKGVWIKLPIELVNLVETAVKEGFWYHHAEPTYLMLVYWIPQTVCTLPANATHCVGIGAFIINAKREVLVVQEKRGKLRGTGVWKIPTGTVDEDEDIFVAAIREVKEETGIDAEFGEVLAFRQVHKSFFGKSDLFFLCVLHPLSFDIVVQELEIEAAQWMPFEEYLAQPFLKIPGLLNFREVCMAKVDRGYSGFLPLPTRTHLRDEVDYLYINTRDLEQSVSSTISIMNYDN
ncbi:Pre-nudix hydrolase domain [Dillenia turbinata]|uniref:Pre-nudix hydrolase domain n=1 Tax=Dillenia turbinata TaxID=194707 RepID=A0AAN8ZEA8_9MAGN